MNGYESLPRWDSRSFYERISSDAYTRAKRELAYAQAREEGPALDKRYRRLLVGTGRPSVVAVCEGAGVVIESEGFWREGMRVFTGQAAEFGELASREKERQRDARERKEA